MSSRIAKVIAFAAASGLVAVTGIVSSGRAAAGGLVAMYAFGEGSGSVVHDSSGSGNDGTVSNATWTGGGRFGGALVFNGSSSRVSVPDSVSLHLSSAMTLEAWVNPVSLSKAWSDVIYKGNDNYYLSASSVPNSWPAGGGIIAGSYGEVYGTATLVASSWTHLALTYDGATLRLYVNGVQVSSRAKTGSLAGSGNPLTIGSDPLYGQYFQGAIDEVRIYNSALTAAQIQTDMNTPAGGGSGDTTPPSAPTGLLESAATTSSISAAWTASTDNVGVSGYRVLVDGVVAGTTATTSYTVNGLSCGSAHQVVVDAYDAAGNRSQPASTTMTASTCPPPPPGDTQPPSTPTGLVVSGVGQTSLTLSWTASSDNVGVTGYRLFQNGTQVGTAPATSYAYSGVACGTSYTLGSAAVDGAGNVSATATLSATTAACGNGNVTASASGPYLVRNGVPFLLRGDSGGSMIKISEADAMTYFADRQARGFNAVLIHGLCGSGTGCPTAGTTFDGIAPFTSGTSPTSYDLATPNPTYWARIDAFVNDANQNNIVVMLDPVDESSYMAMYQNNGLTKAFNYGVFLGNRYKSKNIVWWIGNDFQTWRTASDSNLIRQVMDGINSVDPAHLMTAQLDYSVSASLDSATLAPRISLNGVYSYYPTYAEMLVGRGESATTPVFFEEGDFENQNLGELGTPAVLRRQEWWTALAGGLGGGVYGEKDVHHFNVGWQSHLGDPGAVQFGYETSFMRNLAWYTLSPDTAHTVLTAGYGTFSSIGNIGANDYATAARTANGSTVVVYAPTIRTTTIDMTKVSGGGSVNAQWFDPTNNTYTTVAGSPFSNTGTKQFTPPGNNSAGSGDWVLLLTAAN